MWTGLIIGLGIATGYLGLCWLMTWLKDER